MISALPSHTIGSCPAITVAKSVFLLFFAAAQAPACYLSSPMRPDFNHSTYLRLVKFYDTE